jgi:antitoxin (DNA-binding transcriptional repressor) of toxin-antitoxin stability system
MNKANISYTRNHLSEMLDRVRAGESVLIVDRQRPVARLEPAGGGVAGGQAWQVDLARRGLLRSARRSFDPLVLKAMFLLGGKGKVDILRVLLVEWEAGR